VKHWPTAIRIRSLIVILLAITLAASAADRKIQLRNGVIDPQRLSRTARAALTNLTGLVLLQINADAPADWRAQIEQLGVELLQPVPRDSWIADLNSAPPGRVRELPFVSWLGPYQVEHKLHRSILYSTNQEERVAVLLSRRAKPAEAANVRAQLSRVDQESKLRLGTILRGRIPAARLRALAQSKAVLWIEPARDMKLNDEVASRIVAGDGPPGRTLTQSLGYDGAGVTVAVADSGLDSGETNFMHADIEGRVRALFYYGLPGQLTDAADEHSHGTHCAGIVAGDGAVGETDENGYLYGLGVAPGASLIGQRIFDAVGGYAPPPSFGQLTRDAKQAGADIGSNSWGDDTHGRYDLSAMEFDELVRDADALALGDQPYILEFSAGNAGPDYQTVGSPAVAKNVIATGASQNDRFNLPLDEFAIYADGRDAMTDFSSRGPCEDGRIKPDVVAPGSWIASLRSIYANDDYAWWPISPDYMYQGGTSQAGPHVSGAAAVFVQYWRETHDGATPSPALVKAALINSATDMEDFFTTDAVPNNDEGWGRVDLPALIASDRDYEFTDQSVLLTNGGVFEKRVLVNTVGEPLKITLTYTDVPGIPAAIIALVNDLDLEVIAPDGHLYRGNRIEDGDSIPDAPLPDSINNVEGVHLLTPVAGEYIVRVRATHIAEDARLDTVFTDQDFALVISGDFAPAGTGIVTLDRSVYRAPDLIKLFLVDHNLAGQASANILLRSGAEPLGETVTLLANGASGLFTGAVATATGPAITDGKLQVANNNLIEAIYTDAAPAGSRVFTAGADLQPPAILNLSGTNQFGQIAVSWESDEDTRAELYYGIGAPTQGLTNRTLDLAHEFTLANIAVSNAVKYFAVAQDEAGNRSTNNNGGSYYSITNLQPPGILLLDSFNDYYVLGFLIAAAPPLSGYTNALDTVGRPYNVFDARSGAVPSQAQLNSFRCVIWRISDLEPPNATLVQRMTAYVNNGGSLLLASMEGLTRFTEAGFTNFNTSILQVRSYTEDQPVEDIIGSAGEPVGSGIDVTLDYTPYTEILTLFGADDPSDWILPEQSAAAAIQSGSGVVGLRAPKPGADLPGRVVFFSFPLDAVPLGAGIGNNRSGLLRNALNFLVPSPDTSALAMDSDVYSLPGRAIVEVDDPDLSGTSALNVTVHSPQHTNQLALTLLETSRAGFFRGNLVFMPTNSTAAATYFLNPNDTVIVDYFDVSANALRTATATIETNAPTVSDVDHDPGYLEAIVYWSTDEESDSLVQYSESPDSFPKNLIAYSPALTTDHELFLSGLKPNTTYYYRVTSRDRAGNSSDDKDVYSFTTLLPHSPPWSDNIETNNIEWSTFAPAESETDWQRGTPGGGLTAHSGTNCWGSNLGGGGLSSAECYLISPGVLLTGGNKATLRFWNQYDLLPATEFEFQLAAVEVITDVTASPQLLYQLPEDATFDWEEMELDLTPYMGKVVYIVWYYFLFSFDGPPRMGWLVDDVSITVENIVPGTIQITNNLFQAVYALSGPSGRYGNGRWTAITNAAPGNYTIEYGDVLYYTKPAPQTNSLVASGQIVFNGQYTFTDANNNGLPDSWETDLFGVITTNRTATTDTDGDGLSDYAEFIAGTHPQNPPPPFKLTASRLTNGLIQLAWPSVTNLQYRLHTSPGLPAFIPYSGWLAATPGTNTFTLPAPADATPHLFRVEAQGVTPGLFRLTATKLVTGQLRFNWPSAPGHGYRLLGSTNLSDWTPLADWTRAVGYSMQQNLSPTNPPFRLYRVEAAP